MNYPEIEPRQKIVDDMINHSSSKQMYSFPKAKRFPRRYSLDFKSQSYYNLPSELSKRKTSLGFGKKYNIIQMSPNNENALFYISRYYSFSNFKLSKFYESPKYSFGLKNYNIDPLKKNTNPGPNKYYIRNKLGTGVPKYSFRKKLIYYNYNNNKNIGPGKYKNIQMNDKGKYPLSQFENIKQVGWSLSKTPKFFSINKNNFPGVGKYDIKNLMKGDGKNNISKFKSGNCYSMGKKLKSIFDIKIDNSPGPGSYDTFSEFTMFKNDNKFNKNQSNFRDSKTYL